MRTIKIFDPIESEDATLKLFGWLTVVQYQPTVAYISIHTITHTKYDIYLIIKKFSCWDRQKHKHNIKWPELTYYNEPI